MKYKVSQNGDTLIDSVYRNRNLTDKYINELLFSNTWEDPRVYKDMENGFKMLMKHIEEGSDIGIIIDPDP